MKSTIKKRKQPRTNKNMRENADGSQEVEQKGVKMSRKQRMEMKKRSRMNKLKQTKGELKQQLTAAQGSTKSMGKFDKKAHR